MVFWQSMTPSIHRLQEVETYWLVLSYPDLLYYCVTSRVTVNEAKVHLVRRLMYKGRPARQE